MHRRATTAILLTATGTVLAGTVTMTAVALDGGSGVGGAVAKSVTAANPYLAAARESDSARTKEDRDARVGAGASKSNEPTTTDKSGTNKPGTTKMSKSKTRTSKPSKKKRTTTKKAATGLPSGVSTATSFWDMQTASGKPMSYHTVASPYWPLGTEVRVTYHGKSATGVVEDFGPAEWAVAQHDPPAIIDLSEEMMADLTGSRSNSVPVRFQVLKFGDGPRYVRSGTGYDLAWGK